MDNVQIRAFFLSCLFKLFVASDFRFSKFYKIKMFENRLPSQDAVFRANRSSAILCASLCKINNCDTFFYDSGGCQGYVRIDYIINTISALGVSHYQRGSLSCSDGADDYFEITDAMMCVKLYKEKINWFKARETCQNDGGYLATINTELKRQYIDTYLLVNDVETSDATWIGLNDINVEGTMVWLSGESLSYTIWALSHEPDDTGKNNIPGPANCVVTSSAHTKPIFSWLDRICEDENFFLCERQIYN